MTCRCGHGRVWHRRPDRVSGWQRGRGERPKGWMPCRFILPRTMSAVTPGRGGNGTGKKCPCRNWHPKET